MQLDRPTISAIAKQGVITWKRPLTPKELNLPLVDRTIQRKIKDGSLE